MIPWRDRRGLVIVGFLPPFSLTGQVTAELRPSALFAGESTVSYAETTWQASSGMFRLRRLCDLSYIGCQVNEGETNLRNNIRMGDAYSLPLSRGKA